MELYTYKDFVKTYHYNRATFHRLMKLNHLKPVHKYSNRPSEYDKQMIQPYLKTFEIKKDIHEHPEKYYSFHEFLKEYPKSKSNRHSQRFFEKMVRKYQPITLVNHVPYYLKATIQPKLDELNQNIELDNNYFRVAELNKKLGLKYSDLKIRLIRNHIPIVQFKKSHEVKFNNYIKKSTAEKVIKRYKAERTAYPIAYNAVLQKLKTTEVSLNIAIKLNQITPHVLYLGMNEKYFSNQEFEQIKNKLSYANTLQTKNISSKQHQNELCDIKLTDFCRAYHLNNLIIRDAIIRNNRAYKRTKTKLLYISKETKQWVLNHHINNKPKNYLSLTEMANQKNIQRDALRRITDSLIDNQQINKPHHYIGTITTYFDELQQNKILNYYFNQYQAKPMQKRTKQPNHLKINTKTKFNQKIHFDKKQLAHQLGLNDVESPIRWAKLGQIDYQYDGTTLFFTQEQVNKIRHDYRNYPINPTQLITKTKAMQTLGIPKNPKFHQVCKKFNIKIYKVLGDRRQLIKQTDINKLKHNL